METAVQDRDPFAKICREDLVRDLKERSLFKLSSMSSLRKISVLFTTSLYKISVRGLLARSLKSLKALGISR